MENCPETIEGNRVFCFCRDRIPDDSVYAKVYSFVHKAQKLTEGPGREKWVLGLWMELKPELQLPSGDKIRCYQLNTAIIEDPVAQMNRPYYPEDIVTHCFLELNPDGEVTRFINPAIQFH
jgi:hypothetical protein